jgi:hypothetical protein
MEITNSCGNKTITRGNNTTNHGVGANNRKNNEITRLSCVLFSAVRTRKKLVPQYFFPTLITLIALRAYYD